MMLQLDHNAPDTSAFFFFLFSMPPVPKDADGEEQAPWPTAVRFAPSGEALLSQYQTPGLVRRFHFSVPRERSPLGPTAPADS